ncbi:unnamed protein product [Paramecium sonneborni]|uniref:Uncharacterized protein n=1 Tax=Paramecium sonneborni TaxID=65129 RepID=A0A8S1L4W2_9CILI|nr:unnamed protein product [Paramecium sonneborni]
MQKYFNKKSKSPFLNDKSPKIGYSTKDQSINNENINREQTIEKLILQLDYIRKKNEQEKREMIDTFNLQMQTKIKQHQILETEYQQKNQLLEQLLFQEQSKTIHLTRILQEKQKGNPISDKDQFRNKYQSSESSQDSQSNNTKVQTKQTSKDISVKQLLEIINNIQSNIVRHSKIKRLNINWIDYEILETDLQKQKDLSKSLAKINQIFDKFFSIINDNSAPQLSPYRVGNIPNSFQTIDTKITPNQLQGKAKLQNIGTQTINTITKTHKIVQTDLNNIFSEQIQSNETIATEQIEKNQIKQEKIADIHIKQKEILQNNQYSSNSKLIQSQNQAQQTKLVEPQLQICKIFQMSIKNQIDQKKQKQISTEIQTDPIHRESINKQIELIKHHSKITEKDEEYEEEQNDETKKQSINQDEESENENDSESIFDCNNPAYDSVIEQNQELLDLRRECQEKNDKIINLEITVQQLLKQQGLFQFDNLITSEQHCLQELLSNKWLIKLKDYEAQQKQTIGILSQDSNFIKNTLKAIFEDELEINLGINQFAIQYYNDDFLENFQLDIMIKQIQFTDKIIANSRISFEKQQFQKFWIDFMITHCSVFVYLCKNCNEDDLKIIDYLRENNKKIIILTFKDLEIENFNIYNNFKQNIDYQIIQIQENKNILSSVWKEVLQSDWEWVNVEDSLLVQLQSHIQNIIGNEDCIQLQINEDGIFEISVINDELNYDSLLLFPYIKSKQQQENQIQLCLELQNLGQIQEVKCIDTQVLIVIDQYILLEYMDTKIRLHSIDDNKILLSIIK